MADPIWPTGTLCVKHRCSNVAVIVERSDDCPENPLCEEHRTGCRELELRSLGAASPAERKGQEDV